MIIGLDYDDTYTRDPKFWNNVIDMAHERGHIVLLVTARDDTQHNRLDVYKDLFGRVDDIIFTSGHAKAKFCYDRGYSVDVWTDDNPFFIFNDKARVEKPNAE